MTPAEHPATALVADAIGTWTLDPAATTVTVATKAMWGLAKVKVAFTPVEGSGQVAEDGAVTGRLVIDAASVDTRNKKRDTHLRTADFLDVETHPHIVYEATGVRPGTAGGTVAVDGTLTIHGQTRPFELAATVKESGPGRVAVEAETDLDRSSFGMDWTKLGAKLDNHVVVHAEFTKS